jgi:outer membrane protein OmpA-like peptidoglycan-associated protein
MIDLLYAANSNIRYLGATLQHGDATVDVGLMVSGPDDSQAGVLLVIVEHGDMGTNQVTVDADAMSKGLAADGKIALYGLTFDTDSAKLTAASDPTLKQMSDLLHKQPNLKVYIVGHTDDSGTLAHNLTLSQQRAESVVKALTTTYGIAANRLAAKGLASYAPVASNHSDAGKAKNRRVELVEQ